MKCKTGVPEKPWYRKSPQGAITEEDKMAQLDRLLSHLASKGGKSLKLDPNQQPVLEGFDGSITPLLPNAVPASLLEHLASEIMSPQSVAEINNRGETQFEYKLQESTFLIHVVRSAQGRHIRAESQTKPASPDASKNGLLAPSFQKTAPQSTKPFEDDGLTNIHTPLQLESQTFPEPEMLQQGFGKSPSTPLVQQTQPLTLPSAQLQTHQPPASTSQRSSAQAPLPPAKVPFLPTPMTPPAVTPAPSATQTQAIIYPPAPLPIPIPMPVPAAIQPPQEMQAPSPIPPSMPNFPTPTKKTTIQSSSGCHPLAEKLFMALITNKGSDLHLSAFETPLARINGDMVELEGFAQLGSKQLLEIMASIATLPAWQQFQERNDADFAYPFDAGGCRLRVNFFMDRIGPGLVCRVIPNELPDPDKLGLPDAIKRLADLPKGLVLVTGPTGSGKSTTLAAIIDLANRQRSDHILTIEDPIEFVHPRKKCLVNQREVGTHTDSFKSGLRAALREDPDIVMVGEMRDLETISIALETAITGHLVFGTLHTNSAVGTIDRIVDQFPSDRQQQIRVMLSDALKASLSQTLLKKIGGGRVAAIESLFVTPAIANLIREGKNFQIPSAMQTGRAYGQRLLNDCLLEMVQKKIVEPMEAYMKCPDKETFMATLKRANINWDPRGEEKPMPL